MIGRRLEVDLDAFARNLAAVRRRVSPSRHMLVVKDDAYGHGVEQIVRRAAGAGVEWFGAFDVDTASTVRALGDRFRIFTWLTVGAAEIAHARDLDLDVGVGDEELLEEVADAAISSPVRVHLKIDSGLHRNGVRPERWEAFVERAAALQAIGRVSVEGIWSHIAEASDAEDDEARGTFEWAVTRARAAGLGPGVRHLSASAASFARAEFRYEMVRVGAFAYGIPPAGGPTATDLGVVPAARLVAPVVAVTAESAQVGIGATDGIPSALAGRMRVRSGSGWHRVERIGLHALEVSALADTRVGDEVTIWGGDAHGVTELAESIDSIGEELAVRLSRRIPRVYG